MNAKFPMDWRPNSLVPFQCSCSLQTLEPLTDFVFQEWSITIMSDGPFYNVNILIQNSTKLHENAPLQSKVWDIP